MDRIAMYYEALSDGKVRCLLCPNRCVLSPGRVGPCMSRQNVNGKLQAICYAESIAYSYDPIEKKPLYHFKPGSSILSMGPNACNMHCNFCQNSSISQTKAPTLHLNASELAHRLATESLSQIAFTYTEPLMWYEYIVDFADIAPDVDIILVSNGYINPEPLQELLPVLSAVNIDLKSMDNDFYQKRCGANLSPVMESIRLIAKSKVHLELTNLLIPGLNDSDKQISALVDVVESISPDIPLHFSAYHPSYKLDIPSTPSSTVIGACEIASAKLNYVYAGNIGHSKYTNTYCPDCKSLLIDRSVFGVRTHLVGSACSCGKRIKGVF